VEGIQQRTDDPNWKRGDRGYQESFGESIQPVNLVRAEILLGQEVAGAVGLLNRLAHDFQVAAFFPLPAYLPAGLALGCEAQDLVPAQVPPLDGDEPVARPEMRSGDVGDDVFSAHALFPWWTAALARQFLICKYKSETDSQPSRPMAGVRWQTPAKQANPASRPRCRYAKRNYHSGCEREGV
jgi:hypothetical protein